MATSGQAIVDYIRQFIGTPYVWGGQNPGGFDCSGLLVYGFNKFGIKLNRTTYDQIGQGQAIGAHGLRPGDLVFFETDGKMAGPDHVGIYAGDGMMIHAPRPGKNVELTSMSTYWMDRFTGGRRMEGVIPAGADSGDFGGPEVQRKLTPEELAATYGWAIGFMESNPELKKLFDQAVKDTWTASKFQAELRNTKWWQTTSESARKAQVTEKTDPATWQAQLATTRIQLQQLAAQMGASIPDASINRMVENVVRMGMQEDEIRTVLAGYVDFTAEGTLKGEAGMHEYAIKQYAAEQGVSLDQSAIKQQAQMVVKKMATPEDFKAQIREQAKSLFPGYSTQIDAGITVKDLSEPYRNVMSQELELPNASVTLTDPIIKQAMNGVNAEGKPTGLTLSEFQGQVRNDPRWRRTQNAQDTAMGAAAKVLKDMGLFPQ